jgi:hypothetical protein
MSNWLEWLETHLYSCPIKEYTGMDCPGCGFQRSGIALMRGELLHSLQLFPALIPFLFTWLLLIAHLIFKFEKGAYYIRVSFITTAVLVFGNFFIKMIIHFQHLP